MSNNLISRALSMIKFYDSPNHCVNVRNGIHDNGRYREYSPYPPLIIGRLKLKWRKKVSHRSQVILKAMILIFLTSWRGTRWDKEGA